MVAVLLHEIETQVGLGLAEEKWVRYDSRVEEKVSLRCFCLHTSRYIGGVRG